MQLHFTTVQREGDLRFDMVRTRENAGVIFVLVVSAVHEAMSTFRQSCKTDCQS